MQIKCSIWPSMNIVSLVVHLNKITFCHYRWQQQTEHTNYWAIAKQVHNVIIRKKGGLWSITDIYPNHILCSTIATSHTHPVINHHRSQVTSLFNHSHTQNTRSMFNLWRTKTPILQSSPFSHCHRVNTGPLLNHHRSQMTSSVQPLPHSNLILCSISTIDSHNSMFNLCHAHCPIIAAKWHTFYHCQYATPSNTLYPIITAAKWHLFNHYHNLRHLSNHHHTKQHLFNHCHTSNTLFPIIILAKWHLFNHYHNLKHLSNHPCKCNQMTTVQTFAQPQTPVQSSL